MDKSVYRIFPSVRFFMFFMVFLNCAVLYGGFASFNFAIVCMVNETAIIQGDDQMIENAGQCGRASKNETMEEFELGSGYDGEFVWDKATQANLLSAYAFGAMTPSIPTGLLADRYGAKKLIALSIFVNVVTNALTPIAAYAGVPWLFCARLLQGFGTGISWPCVLAMVSRWGTLTDTGILLALGASGYQFGPVVAMLASSRICASPLRWPFIFYIWSGVAGLFFIAWLVLYTDNPRDCRFISDKELTYVETQNIRKSGGPKDSLWNVPWKKILLSPGSFAVYTTQFSAMWAMYYIGEFMPTYTKEVLNFDVKSNGFTAALPPLCQVISRALVGPLGDRFTFGGRSKTFSIKFFTFLCTICPALCFLLLSFLDCRHSTLAVVAFGVASAFGATSVVGYFRGGVLMAPRYSGIIGSLGNVTGYVAAVLMPYINGVMVKHGTVGEWRGTLLLVAAILTVGGMQYLIFGTAEEQEWAKKEKPTNKIYTVEKDSLCVRL